MKKNNNSSLVLLFVFLLFVGGGLFVYFSSMFERQAPQISMENNGFWNIKKPLNIKIEDASGIKAYKITLKTTTEENVLQYEQLITPQTILKLKVKPPRTAYTMKDKEIQIIVEASDISKWNFFNGNSTKKVFKLTIDKRRPRVNIVNNSYKISRGGSAIVIFKATDKNLDNLYILGNNGKKFIPEPFYKDGYYISLLAWPVQDDTFKATVVATDLAGNIAKSYVPLYLKEKNYKTSNIKLSDRFLKGKIAELADVFEETQGIDGPLEQFKTINEDVRAKNEALIYKITSKVPSEKISDFKIHRMYPLKNAAVVAHFGDHRKYYYEGNFISEAYHLGLDLASVSMAKIRTKNPSKVVFTGMNGIYGNMPVLSHGLGLYTIYGHCSSIKVNTGDTLKRDAVIANTGKSGYAMGDHLHFGVLVQGIEVRPQEWMDSQWIKLNITNIIKEAKKIINRN